MGLEAVIRPEQREGADGPSVGGYELLGQLAAGGMAELHLARRTGLRGFEKYVALKRLHPHLAKDTDFVDMFIHEAKLAATLEHPNVVDVYDVGRDEQGTDHFFTMAYLHGKDLAKILRQASKRRERIPLPHVLTIAVGMSAGLHYAHERTGPDHAPLGIVHRDVSPANVIVTFDGAVKIVDFGIAKAAMRTAVTRVGVRKGKASYMSPEQCRGEDLDRRSDLWAIGVVLYEMTTLTRLFRADHDLVAMNRVMNEAEPITPPSQLVRGFPAGLEAIVMRCLQRDPAKRYQTALELQRELEDFMVENKLGLSSAGLADYVLELFGSEPYPWAVLDSDDTAGSGGTMVSHGRSRPEAMRTHDSSSGSGLRSVSRVVTTLGPGRGRNAVAPLRGMLVGVGVAVLVVAALATGYAMRKTPEPDHAAAIDSQPEVLAPAVPPTTDQLVELLNEPEPARALDFARRHALIEQFSEIAPESIDRQVQVGLDLAQAADAPEPCVVFEHALTIIERSPGPQWRPWVRDAHPPAPACDSLERRLERVKKHAGP